MNLVTIVACILHHLAWLTLSFIDERIRHNLSTFHCTWIYAIPPHVSKSRFEREIELCTQNFTKWLLHVWTSIWSIDVFYFRHENSIQSFDVSLCSKLLCHLFLDLSFRKEGKHIGPKRYLHVFESIALVGFFFRQGILMKSFVFSLHSYIYHFYYPLFKIRFRNKSRSEWLTSDIRMCSNEVNWLAFFNKRIRQKIDILLY